MKGIPPSAVCSDYFMDILIEYVLTKKEGKEKDHEKKEN